ncbi:protein phosphatase 2C, putative [Ichthyophthirius multifiliis]|uniref:Protein phosphatase 2C, putative n=1 Tax=Ichthyophthirius multifiliis TaxID=5932 RepID=G0QJP2_ICHMU|nr:protein phosphatase 2C, putative [Ichthyophthirius multifiliis]EGR34564.1 protein phosphatase 2C, putative [Ichthyophthirius multifiliis]|eukprot:XP_004039868.1 protein phosphatase 2C, putative [Ichthyophthirius multifiliis]
MHNNPLTQSLVFPQSYVFKNQINNYHHKLTNSSIYNQEDAKYNNKLISTIEQQNQQKSKKIKEYIYFLKKQNILLIQNKKDLYQKQLNTLDKIDLIQKYFLFIFLFFLIKINKQAIKLLNLNIYLKQICQTFLFIYNKKIIINYIQINNNNQRVFLKKYSNYPLLKQNIYKKENKLPSLEKAAVVKRLHNSIDLNQIKNIQLLPLTKLNSNQFINHNPIFQKHQQLILILNTFKYIQNTILDKTKKLFKFKKQKINFLVIILFKNRIEKTQSQQQLQPNLLKQQQKIKYSIKTKPGLTIQKIQKINQDSAILNPKNLSGLNLNLFAICDGHGLNGHLVSQLISKVLPLNIQKHLQQDLKQTLTISFKETNKEICSQNFDSYLSGSTLVSILINKNKLYIANVGDSRAIIGKQKGINNGFYFQTLTTDHKPCLERERQRVIKAGGRVQSQSDFNGQPIGPLRVWQQNIDIPGLAMTRSMGDKAGILAGVISEPEISEYDLSSEDKFIVLAFDGIWEYMNNIDVIKCVSQFYEKGNVEQAADKLLNEAVQVWNKQSFARDDITCIVIFLEH